MNECVTHEKYLLGLPGFRCTEFDGFERVGVVEGNEFGDEIRAVGPEPEMKEKKARVEGTAGVHEAAELNRG
jgi:hypothetical protein